MTLYKNIEKTTNDTRSTDCIVKGFVKRRNESTIVTAFRHVVTVTQHSIQIQSPKAFLNSSAMNHFTSAVAESSRFDF